MATTHHDIITPRRHRPPVTDGHRPLLAPRPMMAASEGFRRVHPSALPASGAWRPGDPVGHRRFLPVADDRPFALEGGGLLEGVTVAYETWGTLSPTGDNAVLVCHALTGDSHAAGGIGPGHAAPGWWDGTIGPGRAIDTDRWFVVCANVLGGCQGTTGPASPHPDDGRPWGSRFPVVTIRDMVRTQAAVADALGVARWALVAGGSMGGMQALEWGVMYPERVGGLLAIATAAAASPQQIGWWSSGRRAIRIDPRWRGGDYYAAAAGDGPHEGLATARMISMMTFRSDDVFSARFGREVVEPVEGFSLWQRFQVERYLEYQGDKLVRRFDANSYLLLTKAMDLHDLGRGRGGTGAAFARLQAPLLAVGIDSDILYPPHQAREIVRSANDAGAGARYAELHSPHGHDAFLIEHDQLAGIVRPFLDRLAAAGA
ncbi:MAG TPA: homoserine O-acetyltransferase [Acidimicrobiales bacterium]|nr:homoserine O-acetyltransferase [Acidimicrobiales bacterium]